MPVETGSIEVFINGEPRPVPAGQTIAGLLDSLSIAFDRVAVELDRRIVRREHWPATPLEAGARVEIVHFVGGG